MKDEDLDLTPTSNSGCYGVQSISELPNKPADAVRWILVAIGSFYHSEKSLL